MVGALASYYFSETSVFNKSLFSIVHSFDAVLCTWTRIIFYDRLGLRGISLLVFAFFVVWLAVFRLDVLPILIVSF